MRINRNEILQKCKDSGYFKVDSQGRIWTNRLKESRKPQKDGTWKTGPWRRAEVKLGTYIGFKFYVSIYAHVFVYCWFHGKIPVGMEVDHKNLIKTDTRPRNLELVTRSENQKRMWNHPKSKKSRELLIVRRNERGPISEETRKRMRISSRKRWRSTPHSVRKGVL